MKGLFVVYPEKEYAQQVKDSVKAYLASNGAEEVGKKNFVVVDLDFMKFKSHKLNSRCCPQICGKNRHTSWGFVLFCLLFIYIYIYIYICNVMNNVRPAMSFIWL